MTISRAVLVSLAGVSLALQGCAMALSSFQPAHVPEKGHVQAEVGMDVSFPTGAVSRAIDAAESLEAAAENRELTDQEKRDLLAGAVNLAVDPPAVVPHVGVAYSPFERWELGLRYAASGFRLGVRRQLLDQEQDGLDLTVGLGLGRAAFAPPVGSVLSFVEIDDFVRWNGDAVVAVGGHGDWYHYWGGPRLLYSSFSQSMSLALPGESPEVASISGRAWYFGGYAGVAVGYRHLFIGPELTLAQLMGSAELEALGSASVVNIDSFIIYPGIALMGEF